MDTLVSLGITAACGWSVYAMFVLDRGPVQVSAPQLLLHASGGGIYLEVAASVTTFLLAGRLYEARARRTPGMRCASWLPPGPGRPACWRPTAPSGGSRSRQLRPGRPVRGPARAR